VGSCPPERWLYAQTCNNTLVPALAAAPWFGTVAAAAEQLRYRSELCSSNFIPIPSSSLHPCWLTVSWRELPSPTTAARWPSVRGRVGTVRGLSQVAGLLVHGVVGGSLTADCCGYRVRLEV